MKYSDFVEAVNCVVSLFGKDCNFSTISDACAQWSSKRDYNHKCILSAGKFRVTIIPDSHNFVIKTGRSFSGVKQCHRELEYYNSAINSHLEQYFAKPLGRFKVGSQSFFIFEYIEEIGKVENCDHPYNSDNWDDYCETASYYMTSKEPIQKLSNFLYDNRINDLHDENYGWSYERNCIVYTDYSGYYFTDN